ncbi:MAG: YibE/F family protein [Pleurocapsa sp. SU_196_0]|nr:YibE/F family protein [Pleurocapsa sp. SU_196_0]
MSALHVPSSLVRLVFIAALICFSSLSLAQNEPTPAVPGVVERPATPGSGTDFEVRLSSGELVGVVDDLGAARLGQTVQVVTQRLESGGVIYRLSPGDQPDYVEGTVQRISATPDDPQQPQMLEVKLGTGKAVAVQDDSRRFKPGDLIQVYPTLGPSNEFLFYANDHVRRGGLLWLVVAFVAIAAIIGRAKGLRAIIGMAVSLGVILIVIVPAIVAGWNPVLIAILGSSLILAASVYFVHGFNMTAHSSLVATVAAAILTLLLAYLFSSLTYLTGLGAEEGTFILQMTQASGISVDLRSLLIAGILIGSLGGARGQHCGTGSRRARTQQPQSEPALATALPQRHGCGIRSHRQPREHPRPGEPRLEPAVVGGVQPRRGALHASAEPRAGRFGDRARPRWQHRLDSGGTTGDAHGVVAVRGRALPRHGQRTQPRAGVQSANSHRCPHRRAATPARAEPGVASHAQTN